MKAIVFGLASVIVLSALTGCGGPFRPDPIDEKILRTDRIIFLDKKVDRYLTAKELPPQRLVGGELEIRVLVWNEEGKDLRCDVKVQFLDEDGATVDETPWEPYIFTARTEKTIQKNSMDPGAEDYRMSIRVQK